MAFTVLYSVRGTKEQIPLVIVEVQQIGVKMLRDQPGFRQARLLMAEDMTEAVLTSEWDTREAFNAYRQTENGQRLVRDAMHLHPQISFYEHIAEYEPVG